mmetsp:Transcript_1892/g.5180  ORF Transcript_1892/g.5180 Transcript_1892/m.5180 type:complete len:113 (+) Transcript_1892:74-412(+)
MKTAMTRNPIALLLSALLVPALLVSSAEVDQIVEGGERRLEHDAAAAAAAGEQGEQGERELPLYNFYAHKNTKYRYNYPYYPYSKAAKSGKRGFFYQETHPKVCADSCSISI